MKGFFARRRGVLAGLLGLAVAAPQMAAAQAMLGGVFSTSALRERARRLSLEPWRRPSRAAEPTAGLSYDDYRQIRFRRDRWLWAGGGSPFAANFFAAAYSADEIVALYEVDAGVERALAFDPSLFDMPASLAQAGARLTGYSGFRLLSPINKPDVMDEIGAFQGASYFRSLGRDQLYGLSARGLAIGAGDNAEEFPDFVGWWLETPAPGAAHVVVHGLLDSPSCTGAYRFTITPGANTVFDIEASIYPRATIDKAGVAPASSMFLFDIADPEDVRGQAHDYRSGVHDSDGLAIWTGDGHRVWRPLSNPRSLRFSQFPDADPRGFGLMQRKRDFEAFGDLEARYERRPSLWVEPVMPFGAGSICLLEIPTRIETDDNIACFWRPDAPWTAGSEVKLAYRLHFGTEPYPSPLARVARTRVGRDASQVLFAVDFEGGGLDVTALKAEIETTAGEVVWSNVIEHAQPGLVRATFAFKGGAANLRLTLVDENLAVSETWTSRFDG
jgi:glucans biosynthesis protein